MRKYRRASAAIARILSVVMLLGLLPFYAGAASSAEIQKQINGLKSQKAEIQKQIDAAQQASLKILICMDFLTSIFPPRKRPIIAKTIAFPPKRNMAKPIMLGTGNEYSVFLMNPE